MLCLTAGLMAMAPVAGSAAVSASTDKTSHMTPEMFLSMHRVGGFDLNARGEIAVYAVSTPNIQENNSRTQIYTVRMDGTARTQITNLKKGAHSPRWIPASNPERIAYMTSESGSSQLWSMLPDGLRIASISSISPRQCIRSVCDILLFTNKIRGGGGG